MEDVLQVNSMHACILFCCIYKMQSVCMYMFVCTVAKPQAKHKFTWILLILLTFLNFRKKKGREKIKRRCLE